MAELNHLANIDINNLQAIPDGWWNEDGTEIVIPADTQVNVIDPSIFSNRNTALSIIGTRQNDGCTSFITCMQRVANEHITSDGDFVNIPFNGTNYPVLFVNNVRRTLLKSQVFDFTFNSNFKFFDTPSDGSNQARIELSNQDDSFFSLLHLDSILSICCLWFNLRLKVKAIDATKKQIMVESFDGFAWSKFQAGKTYSMQILNAHGDYSLMSGGEYYFTSQESDSNRGVHYKSAEEDGNSPVYSIASETTILNIENSSSINFNNICFRANGISDITKGCSMQGQSENLADNAVNIIGSNYICFQNCEFTELLGYAIGTKEGASSADTNVRSSCITVSACNFHNLDGGGLHFTASDNNTISDNDIIDIGKTMMSSCAILYRESTMNDILNNNIKDCYYTGISLGWQWGYAGVASPATSHHHHVACNKIENCMRGNLLQDGGGIYNLGESEGTIIERNFISGIKHCSSMMGAGIYLDQASSDIQVRENVLIDNSVNIHINYGQSICLKKNILAYPTDCNLLMNKQNGTDNSFTTDQNVFLQMNNRPLRLPYNGKYVFSADRFGLGPTVMKAYILDILREGNVTFTQFDIVNNNNFNNLSNTYNYLHQHAPVSGLSSEWDSFINTITDGSLPMSVTDTPGNSIRVVNNYYHNDGCVRLNVREETDIKVDSPYFYIKSNNYSLEIEGTPNQCLTLDAGYDYIIIFKGQAFDALITFCDNGLDNLSLLYTMTLDSSVMPDIDYGDSNSRAIIYARDLQKLKSVDRLYIRCSLRGIRNDETIIDMTQFSRLTKLYIGGDNSYDHDQQINSITLTDSQMQRLTDVNIGVRNVPANIVKLSCCDKLYIDNFASWVNLRQMELSDFPNKNIAYVYINNELDEDIDPICFFAYNNTIQSQVYILPNRKTAFTIRHTDLLKNRPNILWQTNIQTI